MIRPTLLARFQISASLLLLLVACWFVSTQNASFWHQVLQTLPQARGVQEWSFIAVLYLVFNAALFVCLSLLTPGPLLKPMLSLLLIVAAVCSYFMTSFGVVIDESMMVNAFQTDSRESSELLGLHFLLHVLLQGVLPAVIVWLIPVRRTSALRGLLARGLTLLIALAVLAGGIAVKYKDFALWARENRDVRLYMNPSYPIYSTAQLLRNSVSRKAPAQLKAVGADAHRVAATSDKPFLLVVVVGETARAANFRLDGYARDTNPQLGAVDGLINFTQATSCGTSTAISVPCMFSRSGRKGFAKDKAGDSENLLDVLKRAGVDVLWLDNNSGCKGVCKRVAYEDLSNGPSPDLCKGDSCYDGVLTADLLTKRLPAAGQSRLLVLHMKGSHGPAYYSRYPEAFRRFTPDCVEDAVQTCSREQIVNAYDNTILYTDHVLADLIGQLRSREQDVDSAVMYLSDHGESLGENGVYLHGLPYSLAPAEQTHIPVMAWFSANAAQRGRIDVGCAKALHDHPVSHDNLFDTVLGLFGVQTRDYRPELDIFRPCAGS